MKMSIADYMNLPQNKRGRNKFNAKKTEYNGRMFDSKAEAHRAHELWLLQLSGEVKEVEYQPKYPIIINDKKVADYIADFRVTYSDGYIEVEDVKGLKQGAAYSLFKLKKKIVEALYNIEIKEV